MKFLIKALLLSGILIPLDVGFAETTNVIELRAFNTHGVELRVQTTKDTIKLGQDTKLKIRIINHRKRAIFLLQKRPATSCRRRQF